MSRDFDIFMSKHLAGQWLLNSYLFSYYPIPYNTTLHLLPPLANTQQPPLASLLQTTLCGRLGEALKSDAYVDFREGQPAFVNIVVVSS